MKAVVLPFASLFTGAALAVAPVTILDQPGWCNWCPSPAYLPDGRVALAFSRWPTACGFEAWCAKSEIALAISKNGPLGPYEFVGTILPGSGRDGDFDRDVTHNPCLFADGGKYYLLYMGTQSTNGSYRLNQRVGIAVADRVEGPYRRTGKPLFDLDPDMTMMSNPAICKMPNGKYLVVVKWGESDGVVRGWPKCRVNHFAAIGESPLGPFKIVRREIFAVNCANFPGEDPYLWTEGDTICCTLHDMGRFYSNEDRALIRFESKDGILWMNKGVLFPRGNVSRLERPAVLCGPDGSRLLFAASKPDARAHNSKIVAYPGVVPEPLRAKKPGVPARFMGFNIWGDYFDNPPAEREDGVVRTILSAKPDLVALQEVTFNWWQSGLVPRLEKAGYAVVRGDVRAAFGAARATDFSTKRRCNHVPLLYRTERYRLLESGFDVFHLRLTDNKGVTWAVLEDRVTGQGVIAFSTHFWWKANGKESDAIREQNAEGVLRRLAQLKAKYPYAALGGGDLNSRPGSWAYDAFAQAGYRTAAEVADRASTLSTHHDDPKRDAQGRYRGTLRATDNNPSTSIDHVMIETNAIRALVHAVVTDQTALDVSDHSPVVVDFALPAPLAPRAPEVRSGGPAALLELLPHALEATQIFARAREREARHVAALRRKGVAEVPPSEGQRHVIDTAGLTGLAFDDWGEIYIDRRFVTDEEMKTVRAIERWIAKWFPADSRRRKPARKVSGGHGLPVFRGFEDPRYQEHDALIARLTAEFNANKAEGSGGTKEQAGKIPDLSPALVKAHMIEESGGNGARSKAAWAVDPLQVNVPGDWAEEKELVGLVKPSQRNEGTAEQNVRAAIRYLARKGFSTAARPAAERPNGFFDGWLQALRRYNGRRDRTDTDRYYSDEYADKILRRANNPDVFVPIEIKLATF